MKLLNHSIVLGILFLLFSNSTIGQDNKVAERVIKKSSYAAFGINYISDAVFMGRKDSISTPYIFPAITYHHKSGFYVNGGFSYLTKSNESRIDMSLITAGFDFSIKKFDGDISVTKYFFNTDSYNVISEVEADITARFIYDFDVINLAVMMNTYFSNNSNSDFFLSSEISHDFVSYNNKFQISPTIGIYLGSQNFYEQYYIYNRFGNGDRHNKGSGQGQGNSDSTTQTTTTVTVEQSEKFNIMAFELSLPIWYTYNSLTLSFLPAYVIPQNPATLTVDDAIFQEELDNTFYVIMGVSYKF